jgi:RNA polymerase sigma factor (sigma-70 family)
MSERPASITATEPTSLDPVQADARLSAFVTEHYDRLLGLARLVCRDATDATDAVQSGLEQAWKQRATLRDPERVRPWLDRIVVREAIRVSRRRRSWLGRFMPSAEVTWIEPADHSAGLTPTLIALRDAFRRLPPDQRAVIALHHHMGYSVAETAAIVDAPVETVRTRLRRATDRLRQDVDGGSR